MTTLCCLAIIRFESSGYLVLLATIPLLIVLSFRSLAGLGPIRRVLSITLRCLVVLCMILALAGAQAVRTTDALSVIFLIDRSASIPRSLQAEDFAFLKRSQQAMRPTRDKLGVVAFASEGTIEQLPSNTLGIERISDAGNPGQTNLAAALRTGMALFTNNAARRVVVVSDGNENVGQALVEADQYAAAGIPIDVLPIRYEHADEVVFERLSAPPTASTEETINLRLVLRSQRRVGGKILLYHNEQLIDLDPDGPGAGYAVELDPGANALSIPVPLRVAGAHRFRAVFEPDDASLDTITANNEGRAFTVVAGQGRILILTQGGSEETRDDEESAMILKRALERERLVAEVEIVGTRTLDQVRLLEYSLVILSNVPAGDLTDNQRKALAVYVRDLGGGLVMVGGDDSFGAGGWMDTEVEKVMPVSFDVKSKKQMPMGALVLVMHASEIPKGNYIGVRAGIAALKTLSSRDLFGVLSYRWRDAKNQYWDVPLQPVGDKARMINLVRKMQMGDAPDLDAIMRPGVEALVRSSEAGVKHMIIISDFDPSPPRPDLIATMKKYKISATTIAIGFGSHPINVGLAQDIAKQTGGKYYDTRDFSKIPQIFIKESRIVRRSLLNETPFTPRVADSFSTLIAGLSGSDIPQLGGYVLSTIKPLASLALVRSTKDGLDPVLAHWQVGLGKTVAFTSGMWTRWGAQWTDWPAFSKLWGQIARWASRQQASAAFDVSTSVRGGRATLRIDALDKNAASINFMSIEGALVRPDFDAEPLQLTQTGPGQYEVEFDARESGSYVVNLVYRMGQGASAASGTLQTGLSVAYSPEYRELKANEALLAQLADRTGGRILDRASAASVFDRSNLPDAETRTSIWEDLVRWMLLLFLLDVAIRRIAINPIEVARKIRRYIGEIAGATPAESSAAVLSTLKGTRDRVRGDLDTSSASDAGPPPRPTARYEPGSSPSAATEELSNALDGASELNAPVVARPTKKPQTTEADYTSRLLKAKRKAQDKLRDDEDRPA